MIKRILFVLILLSIVCLLSCGAVLFIDKIWGMWVTLLAPHPHKVDLPDARLVSSQLSRRDFSLSWSEDGLPIYDTSSEQEDKESLEGLLKEVPRLEYHSIWAGCSSQNIVVRGGGFWGEDYELELWEDSTLIQTFSFSSAQWPVDNFAHYTPTPRYEFSPACSKFALILSGWINHETNGKPELWLLDIPSRKLSLAVLGRIPYLAFDYPTQSVLPSWSPDEKEFVFGDGDFGVEIVDTTTSTFAVP